MFISTKKEKRTMSKVHKKSSTTKIYCEKCDSVFESREKFEKHYEKHSGVSCEACPLDVAISKLIGLFKREK